MTKIYGVPEMNILWVAPDVPFHKRYGGSSDISARIESMAKYGHKIHLVCFSKEPVDQHIHKDIEKICASVNIIQRPSAFLYILNPKRPYSAATRYSKVLPQLVDTIDKSFRIDVACLESIQVGEIVPILKKAGIPIVLRLHNIESQYFFEQGRCHKSLPLSLIYKWESMKLISYEKSIYAQSQKILCISCHEAEQLKSLYPDKYIKWLPTSIKFEAEANERGDSGPIIAFSGSMYLPNNIEAVTWFANKVFPQVLSSVPEAEFWIIGRGPSKEVKELGMRQNIRITGEVPNSHRLISEARVIIVPLFHGAGVKIKLLEAIGLGKLVVSTTQAIVGTPLKPDCHVLVADDPENFANLCIRALQEPTVFQDLKFRAKIYFETYHTMEAVGKKLLSELSCFESGENSHA
jgi:glycosyltransferase involved in cell wall biosynthesis